MTEFSPLRRRMTEDMTVRNLSPATQRSYINAVSKFSRFFGRSPDRLNLEDVRTFQVHLVAKGISWPGLNQIVCALRFFYGVTLRRDEIPERIAYARQPRKLPEVLSADEVVRFLEAVPSLRTRVALTTAYAAGLRASEAVSLKVANIDSGRTGDPGPAGQRRQGSLCHAVSATAWHSSHLLAACPPQGLVVPRTQSGQPDRGERFACRLPVRLRCIRLNQACHRAHAAPFIRHPFPGKWHGYPDHPGSSGTQQLIQYGALYPCLEWFDPADRQPA
jgi:integrase/recombinase XerD